MSICNLRLLNFHVVISLREVHFSDRRAREESGMARSEWQIWNVIKNATEKWLLPSNEKNGKEKENLNDAFFVSFQLLRSLQSILHPTVPT